jgi:peptidoglycan hydrolase-like protein with peptidoglycan-binding domain
MTSISRTQVRTPPPPNASNSVDGQSVEIESEDALRAMMELEPAVMSIDSLEAENSAATIEATGTASNAAPGVVPGEADVAPGLKKGDRGPAVAALQQHLRAGGASLFLNGQFDGATEYALKHWQKGHGLEPTGVVDEATAQAMAPGPGLQEARSLAGTRAQSVGDASVDQAAKGVEAHKTQNRFECARYVRRAFEDSGVDVDAVPSAYQYAEKLANHPGFKEVQVSREDLEQLPKGAVVVWGKNSANANGHIGIVTGKRDSEGHLIQASDREQPLSMFANASEKKRYGSDWGNGPTDGPEFRVFIPVDEAPAEQVVP